MASAAMATVTVVAALNMAAPRGGDAFAAVAAEVAAAVVVAVALVPAVAVTVVPAVARGRRCGSDCDGRGWQQL